MTYRKGQPALTFDPDTDALVCEVCGETFQAGGGVASWGVAVIAAVCWSCAREIEPDPVCLASVC